MTSRFLILSFLLFQSSCASIISIWRDQEIYVDSSLPGAEIIYEGEFLGVTPAKVKISGNASPILTLRAGKHQQDIPLTSHFRWFSSFVGNLPIIYFLPVDFITGEAWEVDQPDKVQLTSEMEAFLNQAPKKILAIAPPQNEDEILSDQVGSLTQPYLEEKFPKYRIYPFNRTNLNFQKYGYDNFSARAEGENQGLEEYLSETLHIDALAESSAFYSKGRLHITGNIQDLKENKVTSTFSRSLEVNRLPYRREMKWKERAISYFTFLPNSVSLDSAVDTFFYKSQEEALLYSGRKTSTGGTLGSLYSALGNVGISYLPPPTRRRSWVGSVKLAPTANLGYSRYIFKKEGVKTLEPEFDTEFFQIGVGYGPVLGLQSRWGTAYLKFQPTLSYTELQYSNLASEKIRDSMGNLSVNGEIGYAFYITERLSFTLFVKSFQENEKLWHRFFTNKLSNPPEEGSPEREYAGVSLGYYFPDDLHPLRHIFE